MRSAPWCQWNSIKTRIKKVILIVLSFVQLTVLFSFKTSKAQLLKVLLVASLNCFHSLPFWKDFNKRDHNDQINLTLASGLILFWEHWLVDTLFQAVYMFTTGIAAFQDDFKLQGWPRLLSVAAVLSRFLVKRCNCAGFQLNSNRINII